MMLKSRLLEKKVALITGCSRGIGKEILTQYAKEGAIIYANCRTVGSLDKYAEELASRYSTSIIPVYYDVTDIKKAKNTIVKIKKEQGRLDILINNAGIMKDALIGMISDDLIRNIYETNVFAVINHLQLATKLMKAPLGGSIINLASIVGEKGNAGQLVYSSSKGAISTLTKTASKELCKRNIRVNAIAPGMIDTDMFRSIGKEKMSAYLPNIGMGRFGTPEDVAKIAVFLGSDLSSYMTGQILGIDGGAIV